MEESQDEAARAVRSVVEAVIAPLIERDGGAVEFVRVSAGRLVLRMGGACAGCPGRPFTLQDVVLPAVQKADPAIRSVDVEPLL